LIVNKNLWLLMNFHKISIAEAPILIKNFLLENPDITALFIMNAELGRYTDMAVQEIKKEQSRKIELISFDNAGIEEQSYIQQNIDECSKKTIELLQEQLEGKYNPRRIFIPTELVKPNIILNT